METVGLHHRLSEHEFEQTSEDSEEQTPPPLSYKWPSRAKIEVLAEQHPFARLWRVTLFPSLFQLLEAICIPWLMATSL